MSNQSTPIQQRIQKFQVRKSETPSLRRKMLVARTPKQNVAKQGTGTPQQMSDNSPLNTAFCSGLVTTRHISKPNCALNACYTPSSLYRNMKFTPGRNKAVAISTPSTNSKSCKRNSFSDNSKIEEASNMIVAVRVRPLKLNECSRANVTNVVLMEEGNNRELKVSAGTNADSSAGVSHSFSYDHVFYSCYPKSRNFACQAKVFEATAQPLLDTAFEGYNACLFAYGQTGSGKSYSMMGIEALDDAALDGRAPNVEAGIIPRFCHELFNRIDAVKSKLQVEIEVSYFEIYNEKIHDLLCVQQAATATAGISVEHGTQRQALKVREHPIWGPYVVDLNSHSVDSYAALRNWLAVGNSQRATASTAMNDKSSRSHSIFNIVLNMTDVSSSGESSECSSSDTDSAIVAKQTRRSKISLVDLAGSERNSVSGTNGERIREGVSINKSLLTLGKVIAALADAKKGTSTAFVPYRESVLTWLLRENLGGNSKTIMLATISPASVHVEETLATLRYACKARSIVNRVKVNESPHDKIIRDLRAEVDRLKSLRNEYERQRRISGNSNPTPRKIIIETSVDETEVEALRQQLAERERELSRAQKSWMEKLKEAEEQRKSELRLLKRKGLALELTSEQKQACLVNLTADPILSGTLFYLLPPGTLYIGRGRNGENIRYSGAQQPDILLDGPLVAPKHCTIQNIDGKLYLIPENLDFETYLNGELVYNKKQMFHGDRLVIGGSHYFRISNPFCTQSKKKKLVDFQLAHQEILQKQEHKLRLELEEEKHTVLRRIEQERAAHERDFNERMQCLELEQLKVKGRSEILETERKAFKAESARKEKKDRFILEKTPSYKSTLLEDINRIMLNPSEESLHKTQLMVKEATQRCRSLGLNFEFRQSQVLDEFGMLRAVILILDKSYGLKAEWPIARLGVWLDMMRDCDTKQINAHNVFESVEIKWNSFDSELNETLSDGLNSSRIALDLSAIKDALFKEQITPGTKLNRSFVLTNPSPICVKISTPNKLNLMPPVEHTKKMLTYDTPEAEQEDNGFNFCAQAMSEVREMQRSSFRLKKLCERAVEERENNPDNYAMATNFREALSQLESVLQGLRNCVEQGEALSPSKTPKLVRFLID